MTLSTLDWLIVILFFLFTMVIGLWSAKKAGKSVKQYFLSGNDMPWWLLGISMVATTFSADTPTLVTDIVRVDGVAGNWVWWAFLLTGMLTVFIYAKLWRRAEIVTDLEFYELRYSGKPAQFLRGFRSIYLGVVFNVIILGTVLLAGIKIGGVMLGLSDIETVLIVSVITVIYSSLGGLRGVILTDFFQFILSMAGMIIAAIYIINMPEVGGLSELLSHPQVQDKTSFFPSWNDRDTLMSLMIIPLAVQWWSVWYPGAEPGGGGYIAQRMLSARNEDGAVKATLFFNIAHYALRPWPWLLIALASMVVFPDLESIGQAFPHVDKDIIQNDLAFPAMMTLLPKGLIGLVVASLMAALMSTISTHLNWGSSYVVHDFYGRYVKPDASEKELVLVGRLSTVLLMVLAAIMALYVLRHAKEAFDIILLVGAGTGLIFILRWFWWRINAYAEITAMVVSFLVALYFHRYYHGDMLGYEKMITGILITTISWITVTFITPPTDRDTLRSFYNKIKPHSLGWKAVIPEADIRAAEKGDKRSLATEILMMFLGCVVVYTALFGTGYLIYGNLGIALMMFMITSISGYLISYLW